MLMTYQIGHEALEGKTGVAAVRKAMKKNPSCRLEILIAGLTETLETKPSGEAVAEALQMLTTAAKQLDLG